MSLYSVICNGYNAYKPARGYPNLSDRRAESAQYDQAHVCAKITTEASGNIHSDYQPVQPQICVNLPIPRSIFTPYAYCSLSLEHDYDVFKALQLIQLCIFRFRQITSFVKSQQTSETHLCGF